MRNRITGSVVGVAVGAMLAAVLYASGGNDPELVEGVSHGGVSVDCIAPRADDGRPGECPK